MIPPCVQHPARGVLGRWYYLVDLQQHGGTPEHVYMFMWTLMWVCGEDLYAYAWQHWTTINGVPLQRRIQVFADHPHAHTITNTHHTTTHAQPLSIRSISRSRSRTRVRALFLSHDPCFRLTEHKLLSLLHPDGSSGLVRGCFALHRHLLWQHRIYASQPSLGALCDCLSLVHDLS